MNMALNRFCIDEEMANESSGFCDSENIFRKRFWDPNDSLIVWAKDKGKGVLNIIQSPFFCHKLNIS